jgi:antitoxin component YwqK of YwqJK toxin-antitoxin module
MKRIPTIILILLCSYSYSQVNCNKTDRNGLKQGIWLQCDDTSSIVSIYVNGTRNGQLVFYKGNRIQKIVSYKNDTLSGISMSFNPNGSLHRKLQYKNGKLNGVSEFYSTEGVVLARYRYINDVLLTVEYYAINKESPPRQHGYVPKLE